MKIKPKDPKEPVAFNTLGIEESVYRKFRKLAKDNNLTQSDLLKQFMDTLESN